MSLYSFGYSFAKRPWDMNIDENLWKIDTWTQIGAIYHHTQDTVQYESLKYLT